MNRKSSLKRQVSGGSRRWLGFLGLADGYLPGVASAESGCLNPKAYGGFTVLFAALVSALLLAVGLAVFDIVFKEVSFATVARDSNYAIYAADTGAECARYWDLQCGTAGVCKSGFTSAFATSTNIASNPPLPSGASLLCSGQDITKIWSLNDTLDPVPLWTGPSANSATTTFTIYLNPPTNQPAYCAIVQIIKNNIAGVSLTTIIARGYNTCDSNNPNRIERAYLIRY